MTPIIGGKSDGQTCPMKVPRMELDGEVYMAIMFRDEGKEHVFYQLVGMVPAEVIVIYRERYAKKGS